MRFHARLERNGPTATGVEVPDSVLRELNAGKRPAVRVTINGHTYRSSVGSMGGRSLLPVSADVRAHAKVEAGAELDIDLELDTSPREVVVPADLAAALAEHPGARQAFDALSYSAKRRLVEPVEAAKSADTRTRRILKAVEELR